MAVGTAATSSLGGSSMDNRVQEAEVIGDTGKSEPSAESKDNVGSTAIDDSPATGARTDNTANSTSPAVASPPIDPQLLKAATFGDARTMHSMALQDPNVLLGRTAAGNTCLHISCAQGHEEFCKSVVALNQSLLTAVNADDETPLITATKSGHASLASLLLMFCQCRQLSERVLQKDKKGCNSLHHAIRSGHRKLALELIKTEPGLSRVVNNFNESPMFIAAMRNFTDVVEKLLEVTDAAHAGAGDQNALHAAVRNDNPDIAKKIMKERPLLAREENGDKPVTPIRRAIIDGKVDVLTVLLELDPSLGYLMSRDGHPLLNTAAGNGQVAVARELLKHCPDTPYCDKNGWTCLHAAAYSGRIEFVQFVLGSQQLRHIVNIQDKNGLTALHVAAKKCNSRVISALLLHQGIDVTLLTNVGQTASSALAAATKGTHKSIWIPDNKVVDGMDRHLLRAATSGDARTMHSMASQDPNVLLGRTAAGNTCLHISCAQGHEEFSKSVVALNQSLLTAVNADDETPLITATKSGHASLASLLLMFCQCRQLSETVLQKDKKGCNALHHAIRSGHRKLALELIETEPGLSQVVNKFNESPMFIAAIRNFMDVIEKMLEISDAAHGGPDDQNALHAAVRKGNPDIAKRIMESRPWLAREEIGDKPVTPVCRAAMDGKIDVLTVLLEHDRSLAHLMSSDGHPLLTTAAENGHVAVARELLKHCPDTPYCDKSGWTCLHAAANNGHIEFVQFVLGSQQLRHLVNIQDKCGRTALHVAAEKCNSRIISDLLLHQGIDVTLLNNSGQTAREVLAAAADEDTDNSIWIADNKDREGSPGAAGIDRRLLQAARSGDTTSIMQLALHDQGLLLGTTPHGNTCLHISSAHGHVEFCKHILKLNQSLLDTVNADGETPLLTAVTSGKVSLASFFLRYCRDLHMSETILKQDKNGCNALHHAIRSGHRELALELIEEEPALTKALNKFDESSMFIAVMRNFTDVFEKLLEVPDSAHGGTYGHNALHAAFRNNNADIAKKIVQARPKLATEENNSQLTPMHFGVLEDKIDVLSVLLEHDFSLGYLVATDGDPLLGTAAFRGHVDVARELLKHCPDAPFLDQNSGTTCLHTAVSNGHTEFVEFVVQSNELRKIINMRDKNGDTALHYAIRKCYPKIVAVLLQRQGRDVTMLNNSGNPAIWVPSDAADHAKTLNWNEVSMLMLNADPEDKGEIYNLNKSIKNQVFEKARKDIRQLTNTYTSNTSLVAILLATITFAAAFTLPGGYSNDAGSEGLPIMDRKLAFQAFLISDTLAMCASLSVAFVCIIARWEDLEFLLYYRSFTKKLMWFAYMATTTAFATGLYTVLAPRLPWLAIAICVVSFLLPVLTKLVGEWPILKLRIRLRGNFEPDLLNMV